MTEPTRTGDPSAPIEDRIQSAVRALGYDEPTALHITVAVMEQVAPWVVGLIELAAETAAETVLYERQEDEP